MDGRSTPRGFGSNGSFRIARAGPALLLGWAWLYLSAAPPGRAELSRPGLGSATLVYFVSPDGNDLAAGTKDQPWRTLDGARRNLRRIRSRRPESPVTVYLRGGLYRLTEPVVFGPEDGGSGTAPVTYRAYQQEMPVLTGGTHVTDWRPVEPNETAWSRLGEAARDKVFTAELPAGLGRFRYLQSDGDAWLACAGIDVGELITTPGFERNNEFDDGFAEQLWDRPELKDYCSFSGLRGDWAARATQLDLRIWTASWSMNVLPVVSIERTVLSTTVPGTYALVPFFRNRLWGLDKQRRAGAALLVNLLEGIDSPGEWALDGQTSRVYLWPGRGGTEQIYAPALPELVRVEGRMPPARQAWRSVEPVEPVRYLIFDGLTFTCGDFVPWQSGEAGTCRDWGMLDKANALLRFRGAENCTVRNCTFRKSGGVGVRLDLHARAITVTDCLFEHLGAEAIHLGGYGAGKTDRNSRNHIVHNIIRDVARIKQDAPAVLLWQSSFNRLERNYIEQVPYCGLVVAGPNYRSFIASAEPEAKFVTMREDGFGMHRFEEIGQRARFTLAVVDSNGLRVRVPTNRYCGEDTDLLAGRDALAAPYRYNQGNIIRYNVFSRVGLLGRGQVAYFTGTTEPGRRNAFTDNYIFECGAGAARPDCLVRIDGFTAGVKLDRNIFAECQSNDVMLVVDCWQGYGGGSAVCQPVANAFYRCNRAPFELDRLDTDGTLFFEPKSGIHKLDGVLASEAHRPRRKYLADYKAIHEALTSGLLPGPGPLPHAQEIARLLAEMLESLDPAGVQRESDRSGSGLTPLPAARDAKGPVFVGRCSEE